MILVMFSRSRLQRQSCQRPQEKKPAFDHIPADTLVLWSISIPVDKSFKDSLNDFEPADEESLLPVDRVSEVFVNVPEKRRLHIIVKAPPIGACV